MGEVTIHYLEMRSPAELKAKSSSQGLQVSECQIKQYEVNRFLYQFVGQSWQWNEKQNWSEAQWQAYAENNNLRTWTAFYQGSPAGYYELQQEANRDIQIAYFGLAPRFIGQGFGGYLLSCALQSAWAWGEPSRVWVHTCSRDHPSALANYQARGMTCYNRKKVSG